MTGTSLPFERIGIVGWGRFGAALGALLAEAGSEVRAVDPVAEVPPAFASPSLEHLVKSVDALVLSVPIAEMYGVLKTVRPWLLSDHVVFDVGSVKVAPEGAMREVLGEAIPWVATHPLFGPLSLARAERPLRTVVCPNPLHPRAVERVKFLYGSIGAHVLMQDAHTHDRAMAETHAVAFFVAKGILDAGVGLDVPYAPPSFQAIARTVEAVRSDAGHLFTAIQGDNPYSGEARRRLLDAMAAVHELLSKRSPSPQAMPEVDIDVFTEEEERPTREGLFYKLDIPDLGDRSPHLREARQHIDALDRELVELLARRAELARRAARAKAELGHGVADPGRERAVLEARRAWAEELGLDATSVEDVFLSVLRFSRRAQQ
jgi:prephenate dehydrogenase